VKERDCVVGRGVGGERERERGKEREKHWRERIGERGKEKTELSSEFFCLWIAYSLC
jgi:hypothetical protein